MKAQCQCGALTAQVEGRPRSVTIMCHCTECQRRTGAPFGTMAYFPTDKVTIAGAATEYSRPADSGATFTTGFCPTCGSSIYAKTSRLPDITGIAVGALEGQIQAPALSVYEQSQHGWVKIPHNAQRHPRGRDS